jgi:hypothetical protein
MPHPCRWRKGLSEMDGLAGPRSVSLGLALAGHHAGRLIDLASLRHNMRKYAQPARCGAVPVIAGTMWH